VFGAASRDRHFRHNFEIHHEIGSCFVISQQDQQRVCAAVGPAIKGWSSFQSLSRVAEKQTSKTFITKGFLVYEQFYLALIPSQGTSSLEPAESTS
jgi:hypothetical protein